MPIMLNLLTPGQCAQTGATTGIIKQAVKNAACGRVPVHHYGYVRINDYLNSICVAP